MNAVYLLLPRLLQARRWGQETLAGGGRDNRQFNDYVKEGPLTQLFEAPDTVWTPRVLKDGADSVGALGALNRVYLNIGTFSEEWLLHFNALVGGKPITPITDRRRAQNSAYFKATEAQTLDMARFFLKTTGAASSGRRAGRRALPDEGRAGPDARQGGVRRELRALPFEQDCPAAGARPRSRRLRRQGLSRRAGTTTGSGPRRRSSRTRCGRSSLAPDFLDDNYLSAEFRVPVTLLETNACSPLATNALGGNIWDNFSSQSYKELPSVGEITWYHPYTGEPRSYTMPAGGRGYTRPPSLISLWSTAPFLLNNTVGRFETSPSVEARMRVVPGLDRADALAREARQGHRCSATRFRA